MTHRGSRGRRPADLLTGGILAGILLALVVPATALPATSAVRALAGPTIDPYARYVGQTTCDLKPKPGVTGVRDLIVAAYGKRWSGISGDCSKPRTSEHKEGRALDISFDADSRADKAKAENFLGWLLATDSAGNKHAMARRLGVMYIVWNRRMWRSYRPADGWQPYTGTSNPHTDHIHLSFSWDGARKRTSWWTQGADRPWPLPGAPKPAPRPPTPKPAPTPTLTPTPTPTATPTPNVTGTPMPTGTPCRPHPTGRDGTGARHDVGAHHCAAPDLRGLDLRRARTCADFLVRRLDPPTTRRLGPPTTAPARRRPGPRPRAAAPARPGGCGVRS